MKKITLIIIAIFLTALFISNTSESEFLHTIDNSRNPYSQHYMLRLFKNAQPIIHSRERYFLPVFIMDYSNLGLFSIANIESGWEGTLRIDGSPLDGRMDIVTKTNYLLIFGKEFKF